MPDNQTHVVVLMGGWSAEREISLITGNGVADSLERLGRRVPRIDMGRDVALKSTEAAPECLPQTGYARLPLEEGVLIAD